MHLLLLQKIHDGSHEEVPALAQRLHKHPDATGADWMTVALSWFALGEMQKAVDVYDQVLEKYPTEKPHLWQRGLALYYNEEYERGVDQFNSHQTLGTHDIENSVWHLLCNAKLKPLAEARKELIPNPGETRRMMHAVYDLFDGTAKPDDVLKASGIASDGADQKKFDSQAYHSWLYVGLYHEMMGDQEASIAAMKKAQRCGLSSRGLMSVIASTHLKLREKNTLGEKKEPLSSD